MDSAVAEYTEQEISMLRCPLTGKGLRLAGPGKLETLDGERQYSIVDGIIILTPDLDENESIVKTFYDGVGWESDSDGVFGDTRLFVDTRPHCYSFTRKCIRRINSLIGPRGGYILDAGSGAIPHREYMDFHAGFNKRICLDLSFGALKAAKQKLGDRGIYVLGSITNIPLADACIDAAVSCHVIYHVPAEKQAKAFEEIARVLKPEAAALVVYKWSYSPIEYRMARLAVKMGLERKVAETTGNSDIPPLYFHAFSREWFEERDWPFSFRIACFRVVENGFMKRFVGDGFLSRLYLQALWWAQNLAPRFCGRHGAYPIIRIIPRSGS